MDRPPADNPVARFSRGFSYPFKAMKLLGRFPGLLRYVAIPFAINLLAFSAILYAGLEFFNRTVIPYLPSGDSWYWVLLYYTAWVLAVLLTAVLVFFTFTVLGNLIASPFNDLLSERAEEQMTGRRAIESTSLSDFFHDARRVMGVELKKLSLFVAGMLILLLLNLIPAIGPFLYSLAATLFTLFFLAVEYLGYVFERKHYAFADQRSYLFQRKFLVMGFGTGVFCALAIPFLQFFCIPLAVLGGTMLWIEEDGKTVRGEKR